MAECEGVQNFTALEGASRGLEPTPSWRLSTGRRCGMLEVMRSANALWCSLYNTSHDIGSRGIRFQS